MSLTWKSGSSTTTSATVYTDLTANFTFTNDDVRALYIDWGDGQDPDGNFTTNKKYANYQWVEFTEPTGAAIVRHTYTASGTFSPVVQTINSEGFASNYYGALAGGDTDVNPYNQRAQISGMSSTDGEATGVMKIENKTVNSGIDNSLLEREGAKDLYVIVASLIASGNLDVIKHINLDLTVEVATTMVSATDTTTVAGAGRRVDVFSVTISGSSLYDGSGATAIDLSEGQCARLLRVEYKNPKLTIENTSGGINSGSTYDDYTKNNLFNFLKIFIVAKSDETHDEGGADVNNYYPLTYVTAGSPIKSADEPERYSVLDFSQSRAKASNVDLAFSRYDIGKVWFNPAFQWNAITGATSGVYEFFGSNTSGAISGNIGTTKQVSYTYGSTRPDGINGEYYVGATTTPSIAFGNDADAHWGMADQKYRMDQFLIDEFGRFTNQYHLSRVSVQPSQSSISETGSEVSSISNNKPHVFWMQPNYLWTGATAALRQQTICKINNNATTLGATSFSYTEKAFQNGSANLVSISGMNSADYEFADGSDRTATSDPIQYFLLLFTGTTNKVFFNISNYGNQIINSYLSGTSFTDGVGIADVSYLHIEKSGTIHQNVHWKSVPFEDTTKVTLPFRDTTNQKYIDQSNSLSQSGFVHFDMPLDWDKVSLTDLYGGVLPGAAYTVTGNRLLLTGACGTSATGGAGTGDQNPVTLNAASQTLIETTNNLSDNEIGAFKYLWITETGTGAGKAYWVAKGLSNGYTGSSGIMNLHYGDTTNATEPAGTITGSLRRINVYDIITGYSKVFRGDSATELCPVDCDAAFSNDLVFHDASAGSQGDIEKDLYDAWSANQLYALKIGVSGTVGTDTFPNIWNIFDGNQGYEDIITEIDDSAWNINSLPIVSDIGVTRQGAYYQAMTRKGKVFIARTGDVMTTLGFSSVALGDGTRLNADGTKRAFTDEGGSSAGPYGTTNSLYQQLHKIRKIQANNVPVYWDLQQKDGTFVRFWGIVTTVNESYGTGGSQNIVGYNFDMSITKVALIDANSTLMTDVFPLGGVEDAKNFT